jgi:hypothetical protein
LVAGIFCAVQAQLPRGEITTYEQRTVYVPVQHDVRAHGAVGDGVADDTATLQQAIDAASADNGGKVYLPPGIYRTTSPLRIAARDVTIAADVRRQWVGAAMPQSEWAGATIVADHDGDCIVLHTADEIHGFKLQSVSLCRVGYETPGDRTGVGVHFRLDGAFRGTFQLDDVAVIGFNTGVLFDRPDSAVIKQIGMVRVTRCVFKLNEHAFRMIDRTQINRFWFVGNVIKWSETGLRIGCNGGVIMDSVFESLDEGVFVSGSYDVLISNNYIGNIRGDYAVRLEQVHGGELAWHRIYQVAAEDPFQLRSCSRMRIVGPVAKEGNCRLLEEVGQDWGR